MKCSNSRRHGLALVAGLIATAWLMPGSVGATLAPSSAEAGAADTDEPEHLREARALHERAQAKYETYEYLGAIELWTAAYDKLSGADAGLFEMRQALVYNLASARMAQYEIDGDRQHLKKAELLLSRYLEELEHVIEESDALDRERKGVEAKLAEIRGELDLGDPPRDQPASTPAPEQKPARGAKPLRDTSPRPGTGLLAAGSVVAAVGVGTSGLMIAGLVRGRSAQQSGDDPGTPASELNELEARGRSANLLAIVGGVAAAAAIGTGVALIAVGARKRRNGRGQLSVSPGGVSWTVAF